MFPKIRILSDAGDVYAVGSIIGAIPTAVKFIADAWGIEYKFV